MVGVEITDINWIALVAAMAASIVLGFLWYAPFSPTGKVWMRGMKFSADMKPPRNKMILAYSLMLLGSFFMFFVFQHTFIAYADAYRLDQADYEVGVADGLMGAFFTWLGFIVPIHFGQVTWEGRPWSLFFVNTGYYLLSLTIAGLLYAFMV